MFSFDLKIRIFGAKSKKKFGTAIFVNRAYYQYTQGQNFPMGPTPKKISFPRFRSFSRAHSEFDIFWKWHTRRVTTFHFGPRMTKLTSDFNFPKILMVVEDYFVSARIDGETVGFP